MADIAHDLSVEVGRNYTLTLWQRLTRFLDYSVLELSNNLAENAIRRVATGAQELDPPAKSGGRTPHRGDRLSSAELPATKDPRSRLPGLSPTWIGWYANASNPQAHACCVGRQQKITVANPSRSQPCRW